MSVNPQLYCKPNHSRYNSVASTLTPRSNKDFLSSQKFGGDADKLNDSLTVSRKDFASSLSFELESEDFGLSLKSIFPNTYHFSSDLKRKHRRVLSNPADLYPANLFNSKRRSFLKANNHTGPIIMPVNDSDVKQVIISEIDDFDLSELDQHGNKILVERSQNKLDNSSVLKIDKRRSIKEILDENTKLSIIGNEPTTVYCKNCQIDVHTLVELENKTILPTSLLEFLGSIAECCRGSTWVSRMRVHRCPLCITLVAKSL